MVYETDLIDSAQLTHEQVMNPDETYLLGFLLDSRTGLGYHKEFKINNFDWINRVIDWLTQHSVPDVLDMPDSVERIVKYQEIQDSGERFYLKNSILDGNVIITDIRGKKNPSWKQVSYLFIAPFGKSKYFCKTGKWKGRRI